MSVVSSSFCALYSKIRLTEHSNKKDVYKVLTIMFLMHITGKLDAA